MRNCIVLGLLAVVAVAASGGHEFSHEFSHDFSHGFPQGFSQGFPREFSQEFFTKTADLDFLHKQKKVFDLLFFVNQDVLTDTEWFEVGQKFDFASSFEHFHNPEFVKEFFSLFKSGFFLDKDALFSFYNEEHRFEMMMLFRLFFFAKDFNTFFKTAAFARIHFNPGTFTTAFTTAVIYRDDTKFIRLPEIFEIFPHMFFDSKIIQDAFHIKMTRGFGFNRGVDFRSEQSENVETFFVRSNFTEMCFSPFFDPEFKMFYFTEDVGLNAFYYNFRMAFPFWINTKDFNVPKSFRGDFFFFFHKQLMARWFLERFSNDLGQIEDFSFDNFKLPGFFSGITFSNGVPMPRRDWWNFVPFYKSFFFDRLKQLEFRIFDAIDSGFFFDEQGKQVSLFTPEGLNFLGNLIEGNADSANFKFFGSFDALARQVFGMNFFSENKNFFVPSSLEFWGTNVRDPAFWRITDKILSFFHRFKFLSQRYNKSELEFPGVRFENVEVDKLVTFFDSKDFFINNAVGVESFKDGKSFSIFSQQHFLNHKPFTFKFTVNSEKETKGVVRVFLGPAADGHFDHDFFLQNSKFFFMLDEFEVNLKSGINNFDRSSFEFPFFKDWNTNAFSFYKKVVKAIEGGEPFTFNQRNFGFPSHLMLPMGKPEGQKFTMFFFIGPFEDAKFFEFPVFGPFKWFGKSFGFPLDRPVFPWFFQLDNVFFKDVFIFHFKDFQSKFGHQF